MEKSSCVVLVFAMLGATFAAGSELERSSRAEEPQKTAVISEAIIERSQFEMTAWPTDGNLERCATLDLNSDVEIYFDGQWHTPATNPKVIIDRIGFDARGLPWTPEPQYVVLYFDEVHLDDCDNLEHEGSTRARAFREARAMIRDVFRPDLGDHVMIASYMGGEAPNITTGWLNSPDEALDALDDLLHESHPPAIRPVHDLGWWTSIEAMANAIADTEETDGHRKTIMIIAADLPTDAEAAEELVRLNQKLAPARVIIDTRRPVSSLVPLAYGIGSMAWNSGGHYWRGQDTLSTAVETKRRLVEYGCRLLVTVPKGAIISLKTDIMQPRFRAESLIAIGATSPRLEQEQREARRLRPRWGRGMDLKTKLWMVGEKQAMLLARISIDESLPRDVLGITLNATIENGSIVRRNPETGHVDTTHSLTEKIDSAELELLRRTGAKTYLYKIELDRVKPTTRVIAESHGGKNGAQTQTAWHTGKTPSWIVAHRYGLLEGQLLPLPAMGPIPSSAYPITLLGYGCDQEAPIDGMLTAQDGTTHKVGLKPLGPDRPCWYIARLPSLAPGSWTFEPPENEAFAQERLTFQVVREAE